MLSRTRQITPGQFDGIKKCSIAQNCITTWTDSQGNPTNELIHAANVFDGSSAVSVAKAKCFLSPDTAGWALIQGAIQSKQITPISPKGYRIPIRLDDPQNLLATHDGKTPGAHLLIGVSGGYHFEEAVIDATDNGGRNVSLLVPFDTPGPITVQSNFFKLQDGAGNSLNKTNAVPITASSAVPMSGFTVKVVGKN